MGSITLNTRAERRKLLNKTTHTRVDTPIIGMKENTFQLELKNRFAALQERDNKTIKNNNEGRYPEELDKGQKDIQPRQKTG